MIPRPPSRREALSLIAAGLASTATASPAAADGLGAVAARAGLLWGAAIDRPALTDSDLAALYRRETRIVTPQNAFKFDWLRPRPGPPDFDDTDRFVAFAEDAGLPVRGHAIIWNDNAPAWLKRLSSREIERVFDAHIEAVLGRYAGRIHSWDLVNEPFWPGFGEPGGFRRGPWYDAMGPDHVVRAYKRAAAVDPKARLVLNEAQTERPDHLGRTIRASLLRLLDRMMDAGAPLHAVGLQGHLQPQHGFDADGFARLLDEIARRGLAIYVTELDVDDHTLPEDIVARDAAVARLYGAFLDIALAQPAVSLVTTWGLADPYSWYQEPAVMAGLGSSRPARPLLFDAALARKPAWRAAAEALGRRHI